MTSYHADKLHFREFWVKMAKMTLKVKVNDPYFQYQPRVSHNACLVQIWWFQLKSVTSYRADNVNFTDGRTDGGNDNTPSAWKAKIKNEIIGIIFIFISITISCIFNWKQTQLE